MLVHNHQCAKFVLEFQTNCGDIASYKVSVYAMYSIVMALLVPAVNLHYSQRSQATIFRDHYQCLHAKIILTSQ